MDVDKCVLLERHGHLGRNRTHGDGVLVDADTLNQADRMIRLLLATLGLAVLGLLPAPPAARADILQPWCLSGGGGLTDHCDFSTYAQCQQTAGGYGVCSPNPAYTVPVAPAAQMPTARRSKR
jgi:Protein of unknown function (DUF3551)